MPFEDFKERRAADTRATLARPLGRVQENRASVRPQSDIEPNHRGNGLFFDQTGLALWGMSAWPFWWGGP